jgi:hypothetical protein
MDLPVQNGQQLARDGLSIFGDLVLIDSSMQCSNQLVSILFDNETDELLWREILVKETPIKNIRNSPVSHIS